MRNNLGLMRHIDGGLPPKRDILHNRHTAWLPDRLQSRAGHHLHLSRDRDGGPHWGRSSITRQCSCSPWAWEWALLHLLSFKMFMRTLFPSCHPHCLHTRGPLGHARPDFSVPQPLCVPSECRRSCTLVALGLLSYSPYNVCAATRTLFALLRRAANCGNGRVGTRCWVRMLFCQLFPFQAMMLTLLSTPFLTGARSWLRRAPTRSKVCLHTVIFGK